MKRVNQVECWDGQHNSGSGMHAITLEDVRMLLYKTTLGEREGRREGGREGRSSLILCIYCLKIQSVVCYVVVNAYL